MNRIDVKEILKAAPQLPTLPAVGMQIVKVANDPKSAAEDLSRILMADQSLSAKILKLSNSSYYGVRTKIASVKQAVVVLGFATVRSLSLSTAVMEKFKAADAKSEEIRKDFWKHSLGVAMTTRLIARHRKKNPTDQEEYYMAGLLHDIGKVVLDQHFNENFLAIHRYVKDSGGSFYGAEKKLHDVAHDQIGGFLAKQWQMPERIIAAIRYHHVPAEAKEHNDVVDAVHFADILTKTKGMGSGGDDDITGLQEDAVKRIGLSDDDAATIVEVEMDKEFAAAQDILKVFE